MEFSYARHFKAEPTTGYETLLFDAMTGDQTLFHRMDMVEAGWQVVQPILDAWARDTRVAASRPTRRAHGDLPRRDLLIERDRPPMATVSVARRRDRARRGRRRTS